jgi:hypothetical protein
MTTATMNAMNASMTGARNSRAGTWTQTRTSSPAPTLAATKLLQQRAALPEMPEQESHASAAAGVALRLVVAVVPVAGLAWLALVG